MKNPMIWRPYELRYYTQFLGQLTRDTGWYSARLAEGNRGLIHRIRAAWLVFTGQADALIWDDGQ